MFKLKFVKAYIIFFFIALSPYFSLRRIAYKPSTSLLSKQKKILFIFLQSFEEFLNLSINLPVLNSSVELNLKSSVLYYPYFPREGAGNS